MIELGEQFSLSSLYVGYKKAKAEAFYENTHFHAVSFTKFEKDLHGNLLRLQARLRQPEPDWFADQSFIGDFAYLPKGVDAKEWDGDNVSHFRALDPLAEWRRKFESSGSRATASLRLIIRPTVEMQIVSALWILLVGQIFDAQLDPKLSFGNRLRRSSDYGQDSSTGSASVNLAAPGLFSPYFSAYREWREGGLDAMENALEGGRSILAITMDVEKFYHRVSPEFLLRQSFLKKLGIKLSNSERAFTRNLIRAMDTWYRTTPDATIRPEGALPIGLSASKIISNVLLFEFDRYVNAAAGTLYYGRYVDDIFLVMEADGADVTAETVTNRLLRELQPLAARAKPPYPPGSLKLKLNYAKDSEIIFAGPKQKIFALSSKHGLDLVNHIRDQIREQSSEYRLLPEVPSTGIAMASRALLATPSATLQADALRKADVVSVRRLGFSLLLRDIETYAADLQPTSWAQLRTEFYELVGRHLITPTGFFEYFGYVPRVFGLMLACGDRDEARALVGDIKRVVDLLKETTSLGTSTQDAAFKLCLSQYAAALFQAGIQAATARRFEVDRGYLRVLRSLKQLDPQLKVPDRTTTLQNLVQAVLLADFGRRAYKDFWYTEQSEDLAGPPIPAERAVRQVLRLGAIRSFKRDAPNLKWPHWPALAFPTRALRIDELGLVAPRLLSSGSRLKKAIHVFRGAKVASTAEVGFSPPREGIREFFLDGGRSTGAIRIGVTSVETTDGQYEAAARGKPDRSLSRYERFNSLINRMLRDKNQPHYIVFPELSVPARWASRAARKLALNGVSLLAGLEYTKDRVTRKLRNDCLVSLTTRWPGYRGSIVVMQAKFEPAHGERALLKKILKMDDQFWTPPDCVPTVYVHGGFCFSVLVCSDLTNISYRTLLRGHIDGLFALEWNPDTKTFSALVESAATDLHAFIIQSNNRSYGDSRIRAPATEDYHRDTVQVKGGVSDFFVLGEIDVVKLRNEQQKRGKKPFFKPLPIGYSASSRRSR